MHVQTCIGVSGLEEGAKVQMMLSLASGLEVKKEQGSTTDSPCTASTLDSLTVTRRAAAPQSKHTNCRSTQRLYKPTLVLNSNLVQLHLARKAT